MKTNVANTSLMAYEILNTSTKERIILEGLKQFGKPATSLMLEVFFIHIGADERRNTITGRFHSLEKKNIIKYTEGKCAVSGNSAKLYEIVERMETDESEIDQGIIKVKGK